MRQVVQDFRKGQIFVAEVPVPALQPERVLVANRCSLISAGTERAKVELGHMSLAGRARARPEQFRQVVRSLRTAGPLATYRKVRSRLESLSALGYSCAGRVLAVGEEVKGLLPGDLVACAGAGFAGHAEIISVPKNLCAKVPPGVSLEDAAYTTVGAIAMHGLRLARLAVGETVAVVGLGLIGQICAQIARASGCDVIGIDTDGQRNELARRLDAGRALTPAEAAASGLAVDAVVIAAATRSSEPVRLAADICRDRGRVIVIGDVGMVVPRNLFYAKELELIVSRSYGPGRYDRNYEEDGVDYPIGYVRWTEQRNMEAVLRLMEQELLDASSLTTHRFPVEEADQAYALISNKNDGSHHLGVLLTYPEGTTLPEPSKPSLPAAVRRHNGRLSVSFIGAGNFAKEVLIPAFKRQPGVALRSVATGSGVTARSVRDRYGFERPTSVEEVIQDPGVDAVVIATNHDTHAALAVDALRAGKAVLLEKPLALDGEQLAAVVEAQAATGGTPTVGFNRRHAPAVKELSKFLESHREPLSMLYRVNAGYLPKTHWTQTAAGGGRILGEACHFVDLLHYLADSRPLRVFGSALPDGERYSSDNVSATITFANGSIGTLLYLANGSPRVPKEWLEISTGGHTARIDDFRSLQIDFASGKRRRWSYRRDMGHEAEIKAFVAALAGEGELPVPFQEAVWSTAATIAIVESIRRGEPVEVRWPDSDAGG